MKQVLIVSLLAGFSTGLGAVIVVLLKNISDKLYDTMLGFAAGTLVGIVSFGLIPESISHGNIYTFIAGFLSGAIIITIVDHFLPDFQQKFKAESYIFTSRLALLIFFIISTSNIFEGIAVGSAYSVQETKLGLFVALGIIAHNIPEGFALALPLRKAGLSGLKNIIYTTFSGGIEPVMAVITFLFLSFLLALIPFMLAFAAGTITYVVFKELIPHSHEHYHYILSSWGMILGFLFMILVKNFFM